MSDRRVMQYSERIAAAYRSAAVLKVLAWVVVAVSVITLIATAAGFLTGRISLTAAIATILGTALAGVLSGGTAYASAVSVGLGAARLEHAISLDSVGPEDERPADLDL